MTSKHKKKTTCTFLLLFLGHGPYYWLEITKHKFK